MDDLDQRILDLLVDDARQSVTVLARRLHGPARRCRSASHASNAAA